MTQEEQVFVDAVRALVALIDQTASESLKELPPSYDEALKHSDWQPRMAEYERAQRLRVFAIRRLNNAARALACLTDDSRKGDR